ncbi:MAG TPA: hypothetical protein VLX91_15650 [Candidatus Acidoferrales bacterium]|nr:hypothetical protein [Candidatus Acidoferrales bacterium]
MKSRLLTALLLVGAFTDFAAAQIDIGQEDPRVPLYRADSLGNYRYRRQGIMVGNRINTLYYNYGEIGYWEFAPSIEWPAGTGHNYLDGTAVLIGARVTTPAGQRITPLVSAYREEYSQDPVTGTPWGLEPVPGYANPSGTSPAVDANGNYNNSLPSIWPAALGLDPSWNGKWYGYFGKGVSNADFETFFVMDDAQDKKFTLPPFNYYPVASDSERGGLGLRVEVRGFQWSHVLAEDVIFWHYDIVNISDHTYDSTAFGFYADPGVGGANSTEPANSAYYNTLLNIAYTWAPSGIGNPGNYKTGYLGFAYLESPGNPFDGVDNDHDGMIDERRDDNIDNNHNWVPYTDLNGNGTWDSDEPLNDDVGADGLGPWDPGYTGPDVGEGDGLPTHGEPHFDATDKDESDQIGLTSVTLGTLADKSANGMWPKNDNVMWKSMNNGFVDTTVANTNIQMVFASGPFILGKGLRERFSIALIMGNDLDQLLFHKRTVQAIYNANYNFTKPPYKPTVHAVAGDRRVYLYWDNIAEQFRDQFLGDQNNDPRQGYRKAFEGYTVYRSEEPQFEDDKLITDSQGEPTYYKPIAQFDLVDSLYGPDPVGINGARFWRGSNSGLQHSYVDTTVENGRTYFYAVCSYSIGDSAYDVVNGVPTGLQPTECSKIITQDYSGNITFVDQNCAVVTPNAPVAGYVPPQVVGNLDRVANGLGTGSISVQVLNPGAIYDGAQYQIIYTAQGTVPNYTTTSYLITRSDSGMVDTLQRNVDATVFGSTVYSAPFDGMVFSFNNDVMVSVNDSSTGWYGSKSNLNLAVIRYPSGGVAWPTDYQIEFYDHPVDTVKSSTVNIPVNYLITDLSSGQKVATIIIDNDGSHSLTLGDDIIMTQLEAPSTTVRTWEIHYQGPMNPAIAPVYPQAGDKFMIHTKRPFANGDYFSFTTKAMSVNNTVANKSLSNISVVPNPYIAAAPWEPRSLYPTGRGTRQISFINLPAKCTIRIYTIAGALVKTLRKDDSNLNNGGATTWDLVSDDGMDIAYGVYLFHVDAPGIGNYIGKFAIIK